MLNQTVLVGRIVSDPQINETKNERKIATITLAVSRNYKNEKGKYDIDFIPCVLWNSVAENAYEYCQKGDVVGVKGRLQNTNGNVEVIAERLTFLSSKKDD